jgi:methylenetetrahydrofolate dehydrogenase (NADP+)/methenyltetrahydrofolate cyclohydrolase
VAEAIKKEAINNRMFSTKTMVLIVNEDSSPSVAYSKTLVKLASELEIPTKILWINEETDERDLLYLIEGYANNSDIGSILPLMPFPKHINMNKVFVKMPSFKDVDCIAFNGYHNGNFNNLGGTPTACVEIMKYYGIDYVGKNVVIINRSDVVGMPLANYLIRQGATVTVCHSKTANLSEHTKKADILVVAVGKADFITQDMVNPNCVIIDVGINFKDGKICGDTSDDVVVKAKTPVPGGVGVVANMAIMRKHLYE